MAEKRNWKKVADAKGMSDPDKAKALHQLIIQHINKRLKDTEALDKWKGTAAAEKGMGIGEFKKFLKANDYDAYRVLEDLAKETKTLRRSLGEFLTTDPNFFEQRGVLEAILNTDETPLWRNLSSWDAHFSHYKSGTRQVGHHTTLSALTDMLNKTSKPWREKFNALAKAEGFDLGDHGLFGLDPGGHKGFGTIKGNKNIRSIKGELAERLAPFFPASSYNGDVLRVPKKQFPKLDEAVRSLRELSSHGNWAKNEAGFKVASELAKYTPEKAFDVARNIFGAELKASHQGHRLSKELGNWKKRTQGINDIDSVLDDLNITLKKPFIQPEWDPVKGELVKGGGVDALVREHDKGVKTLERAEDLRIAQQTKRAQKAVTKDLSIARQVADPKNAAEILSITGRGKAVYKAPGLGINTIKQGLKKTADAAQIARYSRIARVLTPSSAAFGAVIAPLTIADAIGRRAKADETGHWLDKTQARLAEAEAASDVTGVVPNPVSEAVGFGAGVSNLLIDGGRWTINKITGKDKEPEDLMINR
jgi:hypothetical protein